MKRVFIVHRWSGNPNADWYPWLKKELENKNYIVVIPEMPNPDEPDIDEWVLYLGSEVGKPDEDTILVGHSIGCQTILRYLESLSSEIKVGKVILVAPWMNLTEETFEEEGAQEIAKPWIDTPIDFEKIKIHTDKFACIFSNDDYYVPMSDSGIFKEKLNAKILVEEEKGHFTGADGITEVPFVMDEII